ncbi:hypothetical protein OE88DRAFT_925031 [Heliocybe sulcata]|uniref:Uncharacterized protein n=1 Tax=Heliocybe sulcata TaxID=5364 RepID=A0A5C3MPE5_9AGAM|nr:hypothetical protein OE88DRAFT_925031 [Heliocybe sulcata]
MPCASGIPPSLTTLAAALNIIPEVATSNMKTIATAARSGSRLPEIRGTICGTHSQRRLAHGEAVVLVGRLRRSRRMRCLLRLRSITRQYSVPVYADGGPTRWSVGQDSRRKEGQPFEFTERKHCRDIEDDSVFLGI